jgi:hypothetical protein
MLTGCAGMFYKQTTDTQIAQVNQGQPSAALSATPGDSSDVLYNMQNGSLERLSAKYKASNQYFSNAQAIIQAWAASWKNTTTGKTTDDLVSMLLSDNANDYQAKGFEKSFLATFYALNQLGLNNLENARVEIKKMYEIEQAIQNYNQAVYNAARQESEKQRSKDQVHNDVYLSIKRQYNFPDINSSAVLALRNSYQNAFGHYLAGYVFQALDEPSLSRPGYVKAGQLNPTNSLIRQSINNIDNGVKPKQGYTDLLVVETVGHAPQIQSIQKSVPVPIGKDENGNACVKNLILFYPKLIYDRDNKPVYAYHLDGVSYTPSKMVNVDLMAARAIHDDMLHLILRNLVASVRDVVLAKQECIAQSKPGKNGEAAAYGIGGVALQLFLNRADERAWVMLPSKINISRMNVKYGQHTLIVNVNGQPHKLLFNLNQPYQVLAFRIFGNQVYFQPQLSMRKK